MSNSICLNMIVKNESKIITRLFDTVLPIIDCYCICDTGSTDNTKELIQSYFKDKNIPGKLIQEPFKDFGHNRTLALKAAKGMATYLLFLDADMKLVISPDFNKQSLTADAYMIQQGSTEFKYFNMRLVKSTLDFSCVSPTHEYYKLPEKCKQEQLFTLFINDIGDGGCKENKFRRDITLLMKGIEEEPENGRYYFYLANSYFNVGENEKALKFYKKRIEIGGWFEEIYYSHFRMGLTYIRMGEGEKAVNAWLEGHNYYPKRTECMYQLLNYYREKGKNNIAYEFYKIGTAIPYPKDNVLFLHQNMYHALFDYELSIIAFYLIRDGLFCVDDIFGMYRKMLNVKPDMLNPNYYNNMLSNYKFYTPKICAIGEQHIEISNKLNDEFISSTPSIALHNGELVMNLRYVNYRIDDKGDYVNKEQITTYNEFCKLDYMLKITSRKMFKEKEVSTRYRGIEDIRLFSFQDKLLYSGVIQNTDVTDNVTITVSINEYGGDELKQVNLKSPGGRPVEKNWVLFEHQKRCKSVYQWHPLTIGRIENDTFVVEMQKETPYMFHKFRGSTNGIVIGDEIWFLVHIVSYEDRRFYYNCIVRLNAYTLDVVDYSKMFSFTGAPVEYCLGMIEVHGKIVFSYSVMDNSSHFLVVDKERILNMLF